MRPTDPLHDIDTGSGLPRDMWPLPDATAALRPTRWPRRLALWGLTVAVATVAVALFGFVRFGSASAGFKFLGGDRVIIAPSSYSVQLPTERYAPGDEVIDVPFRIYNCTEKAVRILGESRSTCTCAVAAGVPTAVQAGASSMVMIRIRARTIGKTRVAHVDLLTDSRAAPTLTATIILRQSSEADKN